MGDANRGEDGRSELGLSAAEEAHLRRFVRRHAFSGALGRALVGGLLVALALALWPAPESQRAAPDGARGVEGHAELDALRVELAARGSDAGLDPGTRAAVAELAERIEAIAREISALRRRFEAAPAPPPAGAPPAAAADVAAIAERLDGVERRQREVEASRAGIEEILARVGRLEASRDVAEARRVESENALIARLGAVESRLAAVPASPQP
jgi:hypothetical protein